MRGRTKRTSPLGKVFMVVLGVCLVAGTAGATDITIWDGSGSSDGLEHVNETWSPYSGSPWEDNEVEPGCLTGQGWDLEGMFADYTTDGSGNITSSTLTLSGGFDFVNGNSGWDSGDIFISMDTPLYGTAAQTLDATQRTYADEYGYNYIIDVDWSTRDYSVYKVIGKDVPGEARTQVVYYDVGNGESNPWRRSDGGLLITTGTGIYTGLGGGTDANLGLLDDDVNSVSFDLTWLAGRNDVFADSDLYFHFTEECGNDNLMGRTTGEFVTNEFPVPEPASMALLGMGLVGLVATRARKKRL